MLPLSLYIKEECRASAADTVQTPFKNAVARLRNFQRIIVPQVRMQSLSAFERITASFSCHCQRRFASRPAGASVRPVGAYPDCSLAGSIPSGTISIRRCC